MHIDTKMSSYFKKGGYMSSERALINPGARIHQNTARTVTGSSVAGARLLTHVCS